MWSILWPRDLPRWSGFQFPRFWIPLDDGDEVCDDGRREGLKSNRVDLVGEFDAEFFLRFSIDCERGFLLNVTSLTSTMNAMKTIEIPMIDPIIMWSLSVPVQAEEKCLSSVFWKVADKRERERGSMRESHWDGREDDFSLSTKD